MTETTVRVSASRATIQAALQDIPREARSNDTVARAMLTQVGLALLGRIHAAFLIKMRGGTDDAGDRWAPLKSSTIAYSRTQGFFGGRSKRERGRDKRPSQALTKKQQDRWWDLYRQGLAIYNRDKGHAAARAWIILRSEGATTLFDKYSTKNVDILRHTGALLNSLTPGYPSAEQILRVGGGSITIGTSRVGAMAHHKGVLGKLPQRRLWPPVKQWPASWWKIVQDQIKQGLVDIAAKLAREAR